MEAKISRKKFNDLFWNWGSNFCESKWKELESGQSVLLFTRAKTTEGRLGKW